MKKSKPALTPGFLSKKGGAWRPVRLRDVVTLLFSVHMAGSKKHIGFEDTNNTTDQVSRKLGKKKILIDPSLLESCLWAANMLNERGLFWDVRGRDFDQFLNDLLKPDKFNKTYNWVVRKDGSDDE